MRPKSRREFLQRTGATLVSIPAGAMLLTAARAASDPLKRPIKVGQIGTTHSHAAGKMAAMRKLDKHYAVVGVVEPDAERRRRLQDDSTYHGLPWMTEGQLLDTPGLQAVAVETAVRELVPTAARCVDAGKHVHVDKPAGQSLGEFERLLHAAKKRGLVVQMGYMFRYNPAFQFLFAALDDGWLGDIFEVHGVISKTVDADSRRQLAEYPGGTMFELGCHLIDAVVRVLGKPDKVTPFARRTRAPQDTLADNQLAVFEYPRATATIRSALMEVDGFRRRQFVVCGDQGTVDIKPLEPPHVLLTLAVAQGKFTRGTHEVNLPNAGGRYGGDFIDLARIIRGEKQPDYGPDHDLAVHEAVLLAAGVPLEPVPAAG